MRKLRDLGHMKEAIKLAISFYNGTAIAIVGAGDNKDIFRENVKEAISLLSFKYMKKILTYISQGSTDPLDFRGQNLLDSSVDSPWSRVKAMILMI